MRLRKFPRKKCRKRGHKSQGVAEAHLRALLKEREGHIIINPETLHTYPCSNTRCKKACWHVGHEEHK